MVNKLNCAINNRTITFLAIIGVLFIIGAFYGRYKVLPQIIQNKIWQVNITQIKFITI